HYELAEWDITGVASILSTNVAAGKGAVAQTSLPGFGAGGVTDGSDVTEWRSATMPAWIYVNLGTGVAVDKVRLKWSLGQHATSFALYAWNGYGWIPLTARTTGAGGDEVVRFPAVRTQYVLLNAMAGPGPGVGLREFEIYEWRPTGPMPDVARGIWSGLDGGGRPTLVPSGARPLAAESAPEAPPGVAPAADKAPR
ncbi:MAG: discoidin domain-containing protein, partial [Anaerolineae bacterium]